MQDQVALRSNNRGGTKEATAADWLGSSRAGVNLSGFNGGGGGGGSGNAAIDDSSSGAHSSKRRNHEPR